MNGLDADRLARLLGMLGSQFPGEIVNAAHAAEKLRREAGKSWPEILQASIGGGYLLERQLVRLRAENAELRDRIARLEADRDFTRRFDHHRSFAEQVDQAELWRDHLSAWERSFVESLRGRRKLTQKQQAVLVDITAKINFFARHGWQP